MLRQRPRREGEIKQSQHDDVVPLDSDEQAKVVAALEEEAKRQTTVFNVSVISKRTLGGVSQPLFRCICSVNV